ncbi:MAG: non-canonical purine NTP pyrophosphatase [Verrucomicrobia bacterium]|nr:non-canonical purine NTP pyrophosphatase [Verrucomicrobiota bacterium]
MPSRTPAQNPLLWIATRNRGKTREFSQLLRGVCRVRDLHGLPRFPEIRETGKSFAANARLKACALSRALPNHPILADDSGLVVPALGGRPGIRSARFSGPRATDLANRAKLLRLLRAKSGAFRRAYFEACLVLAENGSVLGSVSGRIWGRIASVEMGSGGFGYDSIFTPQGFTRTFGQLPAATKHRISHRAKAVAKIKPIISSFLSPSRAKKSI